jgi:PAS domain S-box-containing protein
MKNKNSSEKQHRPADGTARRLIAFAQAIVDAVPESLVVLDSESRVLFANRSFRQISGVAPKDIEGQILWELDDRAWDLPALREPVERVLRQGGRVEGLDLTHNFPTIGRRVIQLSIQRIKARKYRTWNVILTLQDRTGLRRAAEAVLEREAFLVGALNDMLTFVGVLDPDGTVLFVNNTPLQQAGIELKDVKGKAFHDTFWWQYSEEARRTIQADIGRCAKGKRVVREIQAQMAGGKRVWIEFSMHPVLDENGRIKFLVPEGRDITERKRTEETLRRRDRQLQHSLLETIEALARTIEKRDPYTAGHQERSTRLAVTLGRGMGLAEPIIHGLDMGAGIHDIGKIAIPGEILVRPGRLSQEEFALVKTHVEAGYDIVKNIDLPWPVGEMILQHHERLDGSGYPAGLKGEELRIESKILAVADVVEAISSHRPYRPAYGIDRALVELLTHRGKLYDPDTVDVCVHLFRDEGFTLQPAGQSEDDTPEG